MSSMTIGCISRENQIRILYTAAAVAVVVLVLGIIANFQAMGISKSASTNLMIAGGSLTGVLAILRSFHSYYPSSPLVVAPEKPPQMQLDLRLQMSPDEFVKKYQNSFELGHDIPQSSLDNVEEDRLDPSTEKTVATIEKSEARFAKEHLIYHLQKGTGLKDRLLSCEGKGDYNGKDITKELILKCVRNKGRYTVIRQIATMSPSGNHLIQDLHFELVFNETDGKIYVKRDLREHPAMRLTF